MQQEVNSNNDVPSKELDVSNINPNLQRKKIAAMLASYDALVPRENFALKEEYWSDGDLKFAKAVTKIAGDFKTLGEILLQDRTDATLTKMHLNFTEKAKAVLEATHQINNLTSKNESERAEFIKQTKILCHELLDCAFSHVPKGRAYWDGRFERKELNFGFIQENNCFDAVKLTGVAKDTYGLRHDNHLYNLFINLALVSEYTGVKVSASNLSYFKVDEAIEEFGERINNMRLTYRNNLKSLINEAIETAIILSGIGGLKKGSELKMHADTLSVQLNDLLGKVDNDWTSDRKQVKALLATLKKTPKVLANDKKVGLSDLAQPESADGVKNDFMPRLAKLGELKENIQLMMNDLAHQQTSVSSIIPNDYDKVDIPGAVAFYTGIATSIACYCGSIFWGQIFAGLTALGSSAMLLGRQIVGSNKLEVVSIGSGQEDNLQELADLIQQAERARQREGK